MQEIQDTLQIEEPKRRGRPRGSKNRDTMDAEQAFEAAPERLEDIELNTYEDYLRYNDLVRKLRKKNGMMSKDRRHKHELSFKYAPLELVPKQRVKLTRRKDRGLPINIDVRNLKEAVFYKAEHADGDVVELPDCVIKEISALSIPKYRQVKHQDGSGSTVLDYMESRFAVEVVV